MFGRKDKFNNLLLIDLYKSSVSFYFLRRKESELESISAKKELDYLKVQEPKSGMHETALSEALDELLREIAKNGYSPQEGANTDILILTHSSNSRLRNHEFFVSLNNEVELDRDKVAQIIQSEDLNSGAFLGLAAQSANSRYMLSKKAISQIKPMYYDLENWQGKKVKEFSFFVNQSYVLQNIKNTVENFIAQSFPDSQFAFLHSNLLLALAKKDSQSSKSKHFNLFDLGAEFLSVSQFYDAQALKHFYIDFSVNHIIRDIERFVPGFELARSALASYLKGSCKGEICSEIEKILYKYDQKIKEEISRAKLKKSINQKKYHIKNPQLTKEEELWLLDRLTRHMSKDMHAKSDSEDFMEIIFGFFERHKDLPHFKPGASLYFL